MRLIDKDALIKILAEMQGRCATKAALVQNSKIWRRVKDMPTVDAEPVRHGRWNETNFIKVRECSCCHAQWGMYSIEEFDYCPTCGAKMDARKEE